MKENFLNRRVIESLFYFLQLGITPEKLALSVALGITLSVIPAFGWSVWLCGIFGVALGLNLPVMQAVNYFLYPAQIALLLPFFRLGEKLFRTPHLPLSVAQIYSMVHANLWGTISFLWTTTWHAIVPWGLLAPFAVALLYISLLPLFRRVSQGAPKALPVAEVKAV